MMNAVVVVNGTKMSVRALATIYTYLVCLERLTRKDNRTPVVNEELENLKAKIRNFGYTIVASAAGSIGLVFANGGFSRKVQTITVDDALRALNSTRDSLNINETLVAASIFYNRSPLVKLTVECVNCISYAVAAYSLYELATSIMMKNFKRLFALFFKSLAILLDKPSPSDLPSSGDSKRLTKYEQALARSEKAQREQRSLNNIVDDVWNDSFGGK